MSVLGVGEGSSLFMHGDAWLRGAKQAAEKGVSRDQILAATVGRVERARADGLIGVEEQAYLIAQKAYAEENDPHSMAELAGIADGFGIAFDDLFTHLHLGTLGDLAKGASRDVDGCSALAAGNTEDGPLVAKNRDYSGLHLGVQKVFRHTGPDISTGTMIAIGSLGSPCAYSSGMNAAGLLLADTQVGVRAHRVGWLRYFLMNRILATCATVDEAIAFVRKVPHAGGGTLVLADRTGAAAAIELGAHAVAVERGGIARRTNHYVTSELAAETLDPGDDRIAANSRRRLDYLDHVLPRIAWTVADLMQVMARHEEDGPQSAPVCQHARDGGAQTISSAVYSWRDRCLYFHEGNPCLGNWKRYAL
ncbi:C45 family autoproteolytic acyltransferase/hydolase [Oricola indica]|uniref:C45 family autoproteolytic acyltransferase/hydolase n=1 Tax=Oricola indica TaxID=2872591 RepID=UPI003CCC4113